MSISITIAGLLNNLLLGAAGNALYEGVKAGWQRVTKKDFTDLYLEAFEKAVQDMNSSLTKYATEDGIIGIDKGAFSRFLFKQIILSNEAIPKLSGDEFYKLIAKEFVDASIFYIGGNTLKPDELIVIIDNLINRARVILRQTIVANKAVFDESILVTGEVTYQGVIKLETVLNELDKSVSVRLLGIEQIIAHIDQRTDEIIKYFKSLQVFDVLDLNSIKAKPADEDNYGFYEGYKIRWSDLLRDLDIIRDQFTDTLETISKLIGDRVLVVVRSTMGSGKSTFLKRLAFNLCQQGNVVLYPKVVPKALSVSSDLESIRKLYNEIRQGNKDLIICLDDATRLPDLDQLLDYVADNDIKVVILATSRNDEWFQDRPLLTANMDHPTVEIELDDCWSEVEALKIESRLRDAGKLGRAVDFKGGSVFETMWEATSAEPLRERIHARITQLEKNNQPALMRAYEYTSLLSQHGLVMPVTLVQKLCNQEKNDFDIVNQMLHKEIARYSEDVDAITVGHEQIAKEVIQQRYQHSYGKQRLIKDYILLINNCAAVHRMIVLDLFPRLVANDEKTASIIFTECQKHLLSLREVSTPDELSRNWARLFQIMGDTKSAEACHIESIRREENSHSYTRYAWFLKEQHRYLEAVKYMNSAVKISPEDIGAFSILGRMLKYMLHYEEAIDCLETVLASEGDTYRSALFPQYIPILFYLGRYDEAAQVCREFMDCLVSSGPSSSRYHRELIRILLTKQDLATAEVEIVDSLPVLNRPTLDNLIDSTLLSKKIRKELKVWADGILSNSVAISKPTTNIPAKPQVKEVADIADVNNKDNLSYGEKLSISLQEMGEDNIPKYLDSLLRMNRYDTAAYIAYAKYYLQKGRLSDAENYLIASVVNRNQKEFIGPLQYANFLVAHNRPLEAINYLRHSVFIAIEGNSRRLLARTGEITYVISNLFSKGFIAEVIDCLELLEEPLPDLVLTEEILNIFLTQGRFKELQLLSERQIQSNDKLIRRGFLSGLVIALIKQGRYNETQQYQRRLQFNDPLIKLELFALQLCGLYLVDERHEHVFNYINMLLKKDPLNIISLTIHAINLMSRHQIQPSRKVLNQILELSPNYALGYALLGQLSSLEHNSLDSYGLFEKAIELGPDHSEVNARYAMFLREEGKHFEVIDKATFDQYLLLSEKHAEKAYKISPTDHYVCNNYSATLLKLGKPEVADQVMQCIIKRNSTDVHNLIRAAEVKAALLNWDAAVGYFEKAVEIASKQKKALCLGAFGNAMVAHGDLDGAFDKFNAALALWPSGARTQLDIANYYAATNAYEQAKKYFGAVLEKYPNFPEAHIQFVSFLEAIGEHDKALRELAVWATQSWKVRQIASTILASYMAFLYPKCDGVEAEIALLCGYLAYRSSSYLSLTRDLANRVYERVKQKILSRSSDAWNINDIYDIQAYANIEGKMAEKKLLEALNTTLNLST